MLAAAWYKVDVNPTTNRGRIAGYHLESWHMSRILQASNDGLGSAHSASNFSLRQTGSLPRLDHLADNGEDGTEPVIFGFDVGIGQ